MQRVDGVVVPTCKVEHEPQVGGLKAAAGVRREGAAADRLVEITLGEEKRAPDILDNVGRKKRRRFGARYMCLCLRIVEIQAEAYPRQREVPYWVVLQQSYLFNEPDEWTSFSVRFEVPMGQSDSGFLRIISGARSDATWYVDKVSINEVLPEVMLRPVQ